MLHIEEIAALILNKRLTGNGENLRTRLREEIDIGKNTSAHDAGIGERERQRNVAARVGEKFATGEREITGSYSVNSGVACEGDIKAAYGSKLRGIAVGKINAKSEVAATCDSCQRLASRDKLAVGDKELCEGAGGGRSNHTRSRLRAVVGARILISRAGSADFGNGGEPLGKE